MKNTLNKEVARGCGMRKRPLWMFICMAVFCKRKKCPNDKHALVADGERIRRWDE